MTVEELGLIVTLAGGLGAFFLLTEAPERYGLPAHAESPSQQNGPIANATGVAAAVVAFGVALGAFASAYRKGRR